MSFFSATVSVSLTKTCAHLSISLDGYVAGPRQNRDNPIDVGGLRLHQWRLAEPLHEGEARSREHLAKSLVRMGWAGTCSVRSAASGTRNDAGGGEEPPYHARVFVLAHHAHEPIEMDGGTTFHFVSDGFDAAYAQAVAAAGDCEVLIAGGASTVRQAFAAGVIDELVLDIAPVLLSEGEALFQGVADPGLQPVDVIHSPMTTHITDRVGR